MRHYLVTLLTACALALPAAAAAPADSADFYIARGDTLLSAGTGTFFQILELYTKAYEADSTRFDAASKLGDLCLRVKAHRDAAGWYRTALRHATRDRDIAGLNASLAFTLYDNLNSDNSLFSVSPDQYSEALVYARRAYDLTYPDYDPEVHSIYATILMEVDSLDAAEPLFHTIIEKSPDQPFGYCGLSHVIERRGDTTGALAAIEAGFGSVADDATLYNNSARLNILLGEYRRAADDILYLVDSGWDVAERVYDLVEADPDHADEIARTFIARMDGTSDMPNLCWTIARLYDATNDVASAVKYLDLCQRSDSGHEYTRAIMRILDSYGEYTRVADIARAYLAERPEDLEVMYLAIVILADSPDYRQEALRLAEDYLQLEPCAEDIEQIRDELLAARPQ